MNHLQNWKESIKANNVTIDLTRELYDRQLTNISIQSGNMSINLDVLPIEVYVSKLVEDFGEEFSISKIECQIKEKNLFYYYTDEDYHNITHDEAIVILDYIFLHHSELGYKVVFE